MNKKKGEKRFYFMGYVENEREAYELIKLLVRKFFQCLMGFLVCFTNRKNISTLYETKIHLCI